MNASAAAIEAASALRDLGGLLVLNDHDDATLDQLAATARALADSLRTNGTPRDNISRLRALFGDQQNNEVRTIPERAVGGPANPSAVPIVVRHIGENEIHAQVVIDHQFRGGEGRTHGGVIAGIFDDFTSHFVFVLGIPAMTRTLTISYHSPVPTGVAVDLRARVTVNDGRRLVIEGEARTGELVAASAKTDMAVVDEGRFTRTTESRRPSKSGEAGRSQGPVGQRTPGPTSVP